MLELDYPYCFESDNANLACYDWLVVVALDLEGFVLLTNLC